MQYKQLMNIKIPYPRTINVIPLLKDKIHSSSFMILDDFIYAFHFNNLGFRLSLVRE